MALHARVFQTVAALLRQDGAAALPGFQQTVEYRQVLEESASAATSLAEQFTKPLAAERVSLKRSPATLPWHGPASGILVCR